MRCLVTGADGFLGANLCRRLLADGHEVTGAALNRKGETSLDALRVQCRIEYGDIQDADYVERLINATEAEWIFHLAGVSIVRIAQASPARCLRTNVLGTLNVLESCRGKAHVKVVVVASSDKAYGDHGGATYTEDAPLSPTGPYELSKAAADYLARMYGQMYGVLTVVARCANLFGPGDLNWSRLVPNSCRLALRGQAPIIHASAGNMRREWLDVASAVDAYIFLAKEGQRGEAYNVGSGVTFTVQQIATEIATRLGGPPPEEGGWRNWYEIPAQQLDSAKIRALGWLPRTPVLQALHETADWYHGYLGNRAEESAWGY